MKARRETDTFLTVEDLIDFGQFQQAERLLQSQNLAGPIGLIHQAEVHIYFDRLTEAGAALKEIRLEDLTFPDGARYALALGEWHYWRFEYEPAERQFHLARHVYSLMDNEYGLGKALYNLGRLRRRQAEFEAAQEFLRQALALMEGHQGEKKDYLKALTEYNLGVCADQSGQLDVAADLYSSAIVTLNKLEHGKNYGIALSSYGTLLRRNGRYEESLSVLKEAMGVLQQVAAFEPLGAATNNMAVTLIRLQRFDEAERLLHESLELYQRAGNTAGIPIPSETLAELSLESQNLRKAEKYATETIEKADLSHNYFVKAEALIALGRVALKRNDFYTAAKSLKEALELGEKLGGKMLQVTAMIYLAECEFSTCPIVAQERLIKVRETLEQYPDAWLSQEVERISQRASGDRIRITPDNWLMINGNLLPNWYAVKVAVETFLVKNALRQSGGNMTKAGDLVGISKVHMRDKKMEYEL